MKTLSGPKKGEKSGRAIASMFTGCHLDTQSLESHKSKIPKPSNNATFHSNNVDFTSM